MRRHNSCCCGGCLSVQLAFRCNDRCAVSNMCQTCQDCRVPGAGHGPVADRAAAGVPWHQVEEQVVLSCRDNRSCRIHHSHWCSSTGCTCDPQPATTAQYRYCCSNTVGPPSGAAVLLSLSVPPVQPEAGQVLPRLLLLPRRPRQPRAQPCTLHCHHPSLPCSLRRGRRCCSCCHAAQPWPCTLKHRHPAPVHPGEGQLPWQPVITARHHLVLARLPPPVTPL